MTLTLDQISINDDDLSRPCLEGKYSSWQRSGIPSFDFRPLKLEFFDVPDNKVVMTGNRVIEIYERANEVFDQAIADTALRYVHENGDKATGKPGPLLEISRQMSQRYLDLYQIYVEYEDLKQVPMIPVDAGQLKHYGFTSLEILRMQKSCSQFMDILQALKGKLGKEEYAEFFKTLTNKQKRKEIATEDLKKVVEEYEGLECCALIDLACDKLFQSGQTNIEVIELQLESVARMRFPDRKIGLDERLLMELRHHISPDDSLSNPGSLGQNPLAYLNVVLKGEPDHPEAEFRSRMYFVFMSSLFASLCLQDNEFIAFANHSLDVNKKNWQIDPEFVKAVNQREPKFLLPIFRYGENAALNRTLRKCRTDDDFYEKHPNPLLKDVMEGTPDLNASFRHRLSPRELLNEVGDYNANSVRPDKRIKMASGGARFCLKTPNELDDSLNGILAKQYLAMSNELKLPKLASISGTSDFMTTMAGFVGAALSEQEIQTLKLALLAFMVPCRDHSVHEILQSFKTFGLPYEPGPGFERYIYPSKEQEFISRLREEQNKRGYQMPSYYLTAEHTSHIYQKEFSK